MSINELAEYIGVSVNTVRYWVFTKKITYYKPGATVKFDISQVDEWLESKKVSQQDSPCQTTGKPD